MNALAWLFASGLQSFPYAVPVALAALGENICQKSGVINIGLEGTMLGGAFFGMMASHVTGNPWIGLASAVLAGVAIALLFGWFTVVVGADQVVVGTAVNLLTIGVTGTLFRSRFGQSGQLLSVHRLPSVFGVDPIMAVLIVGVPFAWWALRYSSWGLAIRSVGEYPRSTEAAGFSVHRLRMGAVAIDGLFGGLAGAYLSLVLTGSFAESMTAGRGFVAIAVVTFGRWKPQWVFAAALLIGFVESLQFRFQALGTQIPYQLFIALPYIVSLLVLVVVGKGSVAPAALAQPYRKAK